MNKFLDRYIQGSPGAWYFEIEIVWGICIKGGLFHYKQDARNLLREGLVEFLDDPVEFLSVQHEGVSK